VQVSLCTVCCSVLQCVTVGCSVLQCVAVSCSVLQYAAVCCSMQLTLERVCRYLSGWGDALFDRIASCVMWSTCVR